MTPTRDDFSEVMKRQLATRVNHRCSNPTCRAPTSGPQVNPSKAVNVGVAAHVTAAAPGGPRYDPALTAGQRTDFANAIWLCQNCAKAVDNDPARFTAAILSEWKSIAEEEALQFVGKSVPKREEVCVVEKWVSLAYAEKAGIAKDLGNEGYDVRWATANSESESVDLEGWERVVVNQPDGTRALLKIRDHPAIGGYLILLKKRRS